MNKKFMWTKFAAALAIVYLFVCADYQARASGISSVSNYNPSAVAITGGTIGGVTGAFNSISLGGNLLATTTSPALISTGWGAGAVIVASSTKAFHITTGTATSASPGITMPSASNGWVCSIQPSGSTLSNLWMHELSSTQTTVYFVCQTMSTGSTVACPVSNKIFISCDAY